MLVEPKTYLSPAFCDWLKGLLATRNWSVNGLALAAQVHQGNLSQGLNSKRDVSDDVLRAIAPHLELDPERLVALADLDRVGGLERVLAVAPGEVSNNVGLLAAQLADTTVRLDNLLRGLGSLMDFGKFDDAAKVLPAIQTIQEEQRVLRERMYGRPSVVTNQLAQAPSASLAEPTAPVYSARPYKHLTGDDPKIRPLTDREWRYVDELLAITGGDLGQVSLYKGAPVWYLDEDERLAALRQQVKELKPQAKRKKGAG